jgi:DNA sulfur modification protein DndD
MLLRRLVLQDFGIFRGRNEFDLVPRTRYGNRRPIILVGGKNGSGKTTFLEAIRLCLYGPLALGSRVSVREYDTYLADRIHRADNFFTPQTAAVEMEFEYAQAGRRQTYWVERRWERAENSTRSSLRILRDGKPLDELDRAQADDFLRDLIPPGVSQLFFFDGEKIQHLAETDQDTAALAEAVRGLIGLELVGRLHTDLSLYAARQQSAPTADPLQSELRQIQVDRLAINKEHQDLTRQLDEGRSIADRLRQTVARQQQQLAQVGGGFATQRQRMESQREHIIQMIGEAEDQIRTLCEGQLPFVLASKLCHELHHQLEAERVLQQWQGQANAFRDRLAVVSQRIEKVIFPSQLSKQVPAPIRDEVARRVRDLFDELTRPPADLPAVPLIHKQAIENSHRLVGAIDRVLNGLPGELRLIHKRLETATQELREVEAALKKIPADDVIQPVMERLHELLHEQGSADAAVRRLELTERELQFRLVELDRRERRIQEKLADLSKLGDRQALIGHVQKAIDEYTQVLTTAKIQDLGDGVLSCFALLWRKGDLVQRIDIDSRSFQITLFDKQDRPLSKQELSAGEKQIYAISMLWALARVSGRPLPMIIDTPLGRLDSEHRGHLVDRYFPQASHQVIILSTDTEIDQAYCRALAPAISHAYHLRYDAETARTVIEKGYFWANRELEVAGAAE